MRNRLSFDANVGDDGKSVDIDINSEVFFPFRYHVVITGTGGETDEHRGVGGLKRPFSYNHKLEFSPATITIISNSIGPFGFFPYEEGSKDFLMAPTGPQGGA